MSNEIKIIIGGDASGLTSAAKEAGEAMGSFTGLTNQTSSALRKVAAESSNTADALKKIPASAENLIPEGSVLEARETVKRLRQEIESLTGTQLKSDAGKFLASEFDVAQQELKKLEVEAGLTKEKVEKVIPPKLPLGAIEEARAKIKGLQSQITSLNLGQIKSGAGKAIAADIKLAEKELVTLEAQAGLTSASTGNLFKQAFGGLRTVANILPGIGVAGLVGFATEPLIKYVSALFEVGKEGKEVKEAVDKLRSSTNSAFSSAAEEATRAGSLVAVLKSDAETRERKLAAIKELQSISPETFKNLKLEGDAVVGLDASYKAYLDNLKNVIAVKIQQARLDQLIEKQLKKQGTNLSGIQGLGTLQSTREELQKLKDLQKAGGIVNPAQISLLEGIIKKTEGELSGLNKEIDDIFKNIQDLSKGVNITNGGDGKKEEDLLKKRLEALEKIKAATKDASQLVGIQESIFELQVKIAIRDQGKNQLSKGELDQQINGFKTQLNEAFKNQAIELEAIPKVKFSQVQLADIKEKDISSIIAKATGLDKKIAIPTQFDIDLKLFGKDFADKREAIRNQFAAVVSSIATGIQDAAIQGSEIIGAAFAGLFSGEGVGSTLAKAAQGLLGIVGGILQEVGKQIIVTSSLVKALKAALSKLFGPGGEAIGFAVGAALIATGALLKNFKFDVPKLAQGGIATGPTLGIFGEAGKEAIIPLDKLPDIIGKLSMNTNSNIALAPTIRISLTDLELGLERVRSTRRRLG